MAPQLQINQGPQDALLFDNTRSYFTNVGYVRTSNFQMELRDVDPQNAAHLGSTVNFVIPKAADLLGPCDLIVEFNKAKMGSGQQPPDGSYWGWVDSLGHAMLEKITFSVGPHEVEVLTGEHLNIINELMRSDTQRYGFKNILKTGRPLVTSDIPDDSGSTTVNVYAETDTDQNAYDRIIAYGGSSGGTAKEGKRLVIPLGLFFMAHPSKYFPLAAIAGVNEIRISLKFRPEKELLMAHSRYKAVDGKLIGVATATAAQITAALGATTSAVPTDAALNTIVWDNGNAIKKASLRCHYVHVTGPEATALMNQEHVYLMKLMHQNHVYTRKSFSCKAVDSNGVGNLDKFEVDLSFLHPVSELIITIRKVDEMGADTSNAVGIGTGGKAAKNTAAVKNYFAYQGGNRDPNMESWPNMLETTSTTASTPTRFKTTNFKLTLNGQSRHLDGSGIDRDYLMDRLMPMLHSNTDTCIENVARSVIPFGGLGQDGLGGKKVSRVKDWEAFARCKDRKEIYVMPFSLAPEGANPSGSVNFSKVSHARLEVGLDCIADSQTGSTAVTEDLQIDVYGVYYNWLAIKDGRALTSFS